MRGIEGQYSLKDELARLRASRACVARRVLKFNDGPQTYSRTTSSRRTASRRRSTSTSRSTRPGGSSQKHGHVNEAVFYILDGEGYEIHDGVRYDWKAGDIAIVHNNCVHQHFNADPEKPARALVIKTKPMYMFMNMLFQKQVEPRPTKPRRAPRASCRASDADFNHDDEHDRWHAAKRTRWSSGVANQALYEALLDDARSDARAQRDAREGGHPGGHAVGDLAARAAQASRQRGDEHAHGDRRRLHADHPAGQPIRQHRQLAEECLYVVEGRGYDLHVDCDVEITDTYHWTPQDEVKRFEWEAGDVIYIPPNTISQHFNADPKRPARLISAINRIYKCGLNDLEQLEDAPEYRPGVKVTPELVETFLRPRAEVAPRKKEQVLALLMAGAADPASEAAAQSMTLYGRLTPSSSSRA